MDFSFKFVMSTEEYCRYKNQRTDGKQTFLTFPEEISTVSEIFSLNF